MEHLLEGEYSTCLWLAAFAPLTPEANAQEIQSNQYNNILYNVFIYLMLCNDGRQCFDVLPVGLHSKA